MANNVIEFTIKGIDQFSSAMKKFTASLKSIGDVAIKATKWVAGTAAALLAFVSVVSQGIDETAKFAGRIGIAVDQLSKMQFAASQAGLSTQQFNLATQRMTRRVAEATQGMGEAQGALRELGINAKQFAALGVEDQFAELADRLGQVQNPADRLRLAFKLFDSEGTAVLQMLNQGSPAMRAMAKDAEFLGLVISKQTAADAEHFNDSMGRATGSIKGVSRSITAELMPVLSGLANRFANSLATSRGAIVEFTRNAVVGFFTFLEVIKQVFDRVGKIFTDRRAFSAFLDSIGEFIKISGVLFWEFVKTIPLVVSEGIKLAVRIIGGFIIWAGESLANMFRGKPAKDFSDTMATVMGNAFSKAGKALTEGAKGPIEEFKNGGIKAAQAVGDAFGINMDAANIKAQDTITGLMEFGTVAKETIVNTGAAATEFLTQFQLSYATWLEQMQVSSKTFADSFFGLMTSIIDEISNRMADAIVEGKSMSEAFQGFAKQVLKQLIAMLIKMAIQRLIVSSITKGVTQTEASQEAAKAVGLAGANGLASMAAAPFPINLTAPAFGAAMSAAAAAEFSAGAASGSALGAALTARATGGPVGTGRPYMVGERGPELFIPRNNGTIVPSSRTDSGGSSVIIEQLNINLPESFDTAGALKEMTANDWQDIVAGPLYDAIDNLARKGVKPNYLGV